MITAKYLNNKITRLGWIILNHTTYLVAQNFPDKHATIVPTEKEFVFHLQWF